MVTNSCILINELCVLWGNFRARRHFKSIFKSILIHFWSIFSKFLCYFSIISYSICSTTILARFGYIFRLVLCWESDKNYFISHKTRNSLKVFLTYFFWCLVFLVVLSRIFRQFMWIMQQIILCITASTVHYGTMIYKIARYAMTFLRWTDKSCAHFYCWISSQWFILGPF